MTDRKIFDLFYGARENDHDMCVRAYEKGADINFAFDGRRATKGGAGRWWVTCFVHCGGVVYNEIVNWHCLADGLSRSGSRLSVNNPKVIHVSQRAKCSPFLGNSPKVVRKGAQQ